MKRIILASGLLLAVPSAHAINPDVRLSGTFGLGLSWLHDDNDFAQIDDWNVENNASNFRIEAAANELGLRAFMTYERGASNDHTGVEDVRQFFGGMSNHFGTLLYGRKATDYRIAGERLDPFYNTSVAGFNGQFASEGASYGFSNLTNGFTSNTIAVRSPVYGGFAGNLAIYVNDNNNQGSGDKPDMGGGFSYTNSRWLGLDASLQALRLRGNVVAGAPAGETNAARLSASIGEKSWALGLSLEYLDVAAEPDPREYAYLSGTYQLSQDWRLAAAYGHVGNTVGAGGFDGNGGTVGTFYELMHNLSVYGAVRHVGITNGKRDDVTTVATGVKFVFDVDL